jgi:integrase
MRLDQSTVSALTCPEGRRDCWVFDGELKGFAVRVTAKGTKVFHVRYRYAGQVRSLPVGQWGHVTATQARRLALKALGEVAAGHDPWGERRTEVAAARAQKQERDRQTQADAFTLTALIDSWEAIGLREASATHRKEAPRALRRALTPLLARSAHAVDAGEAQKQIDLLAAGKPVMARRTRDYARAAFNWAVKRRLVATNPFATVVVEAKERSRDRRLSDLELAAAWQAAGALHYPFGPFLRMLILTLQRRGEVAAMRWEELDADLATWTIPRERAKNRKEHVVHLAEPARAILRALRQQAASPLVFTTDGVTPIAGFSRAKVQLARTAARQKRAASDTLPESDESDEIQLGWRLHDLRRTGVSVMAQLGFAPHIADRILNHVQGSIRGVAAVYQRHEFLAEREAALKAWADYVLTAAGERPAKGNVVKLRRAAKRATLK